MKNLEKIAVLKSQDAVNIVRTTLGLVDKRLVDHGERVAYILYEMLKDRGCYTEEECLEICILGIFHDIGAYKTDEIDQMVMFETNNVWEHSIYGYLFLKYLSPLSEMSKAILYHHLRYDKFDQVDVSDRDKEIALLIRLADRVDICLQTEPRAIELSRIESGRGTGFDPKHIDWFRESNERYGIIKNLKNHYYQEVIDHLVEKIKLNNEEINQYTQMLSYSIDFRSEHTVAHTINTVAISVEIAKKLDYTLEQLSRIYYGALLHDIGKISIPLEILEYPGKLSYQAMNIMRTHVEITESIIKGIVDDDICKIAVRHHESPDGSGYPRGLKGESLNESQRIVAVADVLSALRGQRSYKDCFPKEQIIGIIGEMTEKNKLCAVITTIVIENYDEIMVGADERCKALLWTYRNFTDEFKQLYDKLAGL